MVKIPKRDVMTLTGQLCPTCNEWTELRESGEIYDKDFGLVYMCPKCGAYVGVHRGTINAKGSVANKELRGLRKQAHFYFDALWQKNIMGRTQAYKWLSLQLGTPPELTHIGMFTTEQCEEVVRICKQHLRTYGKETTE